LLPCFIFIIIHTLCCEWRLKSGNQPGNCVFWQNMWNHTCSWIKHCWGIVTCYQGGR
jgi:hypothetical protein